MISKELYEFLKAWRNWVGTGAPEGPFFRRTGLCANILKFYRDFSNQFSIQRELLALLQQEFEGHQYPFGEDNYHDRDINETQHKDPARLAWVDKKIKEYEEAQK